MTMIYSHRLPVGSAMPLEILAELPENSACREEQSACSPDLETVGRVLGFALILVMLPFTFRFFDPATTMGFCLAVWLNVPPRNSFVGTDESPV